MGEDPDQACDLGRLYSLYGQTILVYCMRLLGDCASAEDATQEVFLRVRRHAGLKPAVDQMRPWLLRIATNHCLNELRKRRTRASTPPQLAPLTVSNLEDTLAARDFLKRLPSRDRDIAWLTYVDGMLQQEVADTLGVSRRTVVNYLSRVRSRPPT
ncbi:MAG TPA: RNA polymerase sigma factor [Polyangiaceae bacterium]|nr:RNA polymerase sigma factor [Polyangiaceae bacterium]